MKDKFFPLFVSLEGCRILMVGAGNIALRRVKTLLHFTDELTVLSPEFQEEFFMLEKTHPGLVLERSGFDPAYLQEIQYVFACTDDPELNARIVSECRDRGIPVNNCSRKEDCSFYFPGIVEKDGIVIGITASGEDHKKARQIRERIEKLLEEMEL